MKRTILLLAVYLLLGLPAYGQTIQQNLWETNGTVSATVYEQSSNTVYIGGNFSYVGPHTGNGVALDATSGIRDAAFPKVNGLILAAVSDGSGGWFIGGTFTSVGGVPRNGIAHILPNKTLNPSWNPDASGAIMALAVSGSTVYAGGNFTSIGGQARNRIAALDATTGTATAWDPNAGNDVYALAVSGTTVYAAGNFNSIGGQTRICIAALDATTGIATGWDPTANNTVRALAVSGSTVYAGGDFTSIGGQARNRIAALDAITGSATGWDPNANSSLSALAVSGSTIYAGGTFSSIGGQTRICIAALDATTGAATSWNPDANGFVVALAVAGSTIYAGGGFKIIGGQPRNYIAALDATSGTATSWDPNAGGVVQTFAISGATVYAGGAFTSIGGQNRNRIAALNGTSGVATAWNPDANGNVFALSISGTTVYAGGSFTSIGGQTRNRIAAIDASTGSATSFNPNANGSVNAIAVSGSTVYAGGAFTSIGGSTRNRIAALSATTGAASSWNPSASNTVNTLAVSNSVVYAGGAFTSIGGQARNRIAALDATTGAATGWDPNANGAVRAISESGSIIYVGGDFNTIGGQTRRCAALDAITGAVTSWDPNIDGGVWALAVSGSTIYAGGGFNNAGGQPRSRIAALDATTGAATAWNPNASSDVRSLAVNGSTVYAGGLFASILGENRKGFAALTNGCDPLVISTPPVNQTKCAGESVTFSVTASGTDLTYQWRKNSVDIPGASSENYTIPSASPGDDGNYDVVIGNSCTPSQTSSIAVLTVNTPPSITSHPGSATRCEGEPITFSVSATGSALTYQWRKNGVDIPGAESETYTISSVVTADAGNYDVIVTGACAPSQTSAVATLTVNETATITASGPTSFCEGGSVVLEASDGIAWLWSNNETTRSITATTGGDYSVTVTYANNCSTTSGAVTVTVHPLPAVSITAQGPTTFCEGASVTLTASGAASYLWSTSESTPSITVSASGSYSVIGTDANGCFATSAPVEVLVQPLVTAGILSGSPSLCVGSSASFSSNGTPGGVWSSADNTVATVHPSSGLVTAVGAGNTTISYTLTSGCGSPSTASASVQVNACATFCTSGQGYYGATSNIALVNTLLPITIGKPGRSLTFEANQGSCLASKLPAGGPPSVLPSGIGDYSVGTSLCPTNTIIPLSSTGRFNNVLLGQTIALTLNIRRDNLLAAFTLPASFCTRRDAQSPIAGPYAIPGLVFTALSNLTLQHTAGGLLELANRALAGQSTAGASLSHINDAVTAINEAFDECRTVVSCATPKHAAVDAGAAVRLHGNYPNPFNPSTTIRYTLPDQAHVTLRVFDLYSREVATLVEGTQGAGSYAVHFDAGALPAGTYICRIESSGTVLSRTMMLLK
ncbi:MAG: immunoglobulin domain-containing protein [Bacteroidia bacterium]|nr:immunoglobulin domain-containing protein [Bacteroidia bacterium]